MAEGKGGAPTDSCDPRRYFALPTPRGTARAPCAGHKVRRRLPRGRGGGGCSVPDLPVEVAGSKQRGGRLPGRCAKGAQFFPPPVVRRRLYAWPMSVVPTVGRERARTRKREGWGVARGNGGASAQSMATGGSSTPKRLFGAAEKGGAPRGEMSEPVVRRSFGLSRATCRPRASARGAQS